MDFANARGAAVLAALVVVACSSSSSTSSSNGGETAGDGRRGARDQDGASSGSSGGGDNYDAAVDYDAAVAACATSPSEVQRTACCEQAIPRGYLTLHVAEEDCLCGSTGPCTSACNYQDCMSLQASTPTCQSCLDANLAGSCKGAVASACAGDPGCTAYQACVMG
ncbi:MAG TPA: hypothetical protein VMI75_08660 [Polyangiaceae bacterium]|nr:hypothetical protein [Polyangiaceae bacterium]